MVKSIKQSPSARRPGWPKTSTMRPKTVLATIGRLNALSSVGSIPGLLQWTVLVYPSKAEFDTLVKFVGGKTIGGKKLKSTSGWHIYDDAGAYGGNGSDDYGFNVLSAGYWFVHIDDAESYEYNDYVGEKTGFWTTDEDKRVREHEFDDLVYIMSLDNWDGDVSIHGAVKYYRYSVRCIKD